MGNQGGKSLSWDTPIPGSMKKLCCLFISHFAPERTRTDPHTGLPWYLSERTRFIGLWGKPEYRKVGFLEHCERVFEVRLNRAGWLNGPWAVLKLACLGYRPDVVICGVDEYSLALGWFAGKTVHAPVFCMIEDPPFTDRYLPPMGWIRRNERRFRRLLVGKFLRSLSGIFCFIEKEVLREFDIGLTPVYQLMNGTSNKALDWLRSRHRPLNRFSELRIGYVGALNRRQGIDDLLEIFAEARRKEPLLRLRLIGPLEQDYASNYQERIRNLALDGNVEVTGWLPYERMLEKLQECHIGVYCNQPGEWVQVAQPLKICEYLALCIPTVAWDYPGVRRLLDGGRLGILIPSGQKSPFVDAIVRLTDPNERGSFEAEIGVAIKTRWSSDYWYEETLKKIKSSTLT
jgi:glycosyltransferase involved in cell wall biosynthesis